MVHLTRTLPRIGDRFEAEYYADTSAAQAIALVSKHTTALHIVDDVDPLVPTTEPFQVGLNGFVGRDQELALIERAILQALEGRGSTILVSGEAGIGKSRLGREAASIAERSGLNAYFGRFHELESNLAYLPFTRILGEVASGPVGPELTRLLAMATPLHRGLSTTTVPADPGDREQLNQEVWECLSEASLRRPLLLVLDDVQWADISSSLSLLDFVLPRIRTVPIVLLLLRRAPALSTGNEPNSASASYTFDWHTPHLVRCDLMGLSLADVEQLLVQSSAEELDDAGISLARAAHRRAAGNPLFVEEILRHVIQTGQLAERTGDSRSYESSPRELELPPGLKEVISGRLALVPGQWRHVLSYAAVLGNVFDFDILAAMTDSDEEEVILAVEHALSAQLLIEAPTSDRAEYEFRHEVVRQVLYEGLSKPRRQKLHVRAASAVEMSHRGSDSYEKVEQIARHLELAGRYADPEKTLRYSIQAAGHAERLYSYDQAIVHLERAVKALQFNGGNAEEQAALLDRLAALYFVTGISPEKGKDCTARAIAIYRTLGMEEEAGRAHSRLMWQYSSNQESLNLPRARQELKAAEDMLQGGPDRASVGYFHVGRAGAALWELRTTEGLSASSKAMDVANAIGDEALWASAAGMHGWHLAMSGSVDEGMALCERAWHVAEQQNNFVWTFRAAWYRGTMSYLIGDPLEARNWFQREAQRPHLAGALTQRRSLTERLGNALSTMGNIDGAAKAAEELDHEGVLDATICFRKGLWERAEELWRESKTKAILAGDAFDVWRANYRLAQLYQLRGQLEEARGILEEALKATTDKAVVLEAHTRTKLAQVLAALGDPAATQHLGRVQEIVAQGGDWRGLPGHVWLARASVQRMHGDGAGESSSLHSALEVFERFQNPWECIEILLILACRESSKEQYLSRAEALATRIGAGGYWESRKALSMHPLAERDSASLKLSPREVEVLALLRAGKTNKEIADSLVISHHTVARHVSAILRKANIGNRTAAASLFARMERSLK
jgi:DNA-binding CsgD family transcriptional regulator